MRYCTHAYVPGTVESVSFKEDVGEIYYNY